MTVIFEPATRGRFLACVAALGFLALAPVWARTPLGAQDGIALSRPAGDGLPEIGAELTIGRPVACVLAVITDYDHFAQFVPYTAESRVIGVRDGHALVFQRLSLPPPIADRAYVLESRVTDRNGVARVDIDLAEDQAAPQAGGAIAPRVFRGHWELAIADGGVATQARYVIALDPGGRLPRWLTIWSLQRFVPAIVAAVRARAETEPCTVN